MAEQDRYLFGGGGVWCEAIMELRQSGAKGCAPQLCHCVKLLNFPYLINVLWLQKYTLKYILKIYTLRHYCIKKGATDSQTVKKKCCCCSVAKSYLTLS